MAVVACETARKPVMGLDYDPSHHFATAHGFQKFRSLCPRTHPVHMRRDDSWVSQANGRTQVIKQKARAFPCPGAAGMGSSGLFVQTNAQAIDLPFSTLAQLTEAAQHAVNASQHPFSRPIPRYAPDNEGLLPCGPLRIEPMNLCRVLRAILCGSPKTFRGGSLVYRSP